MPDHDPNEPKVTILSIAIGEEKQPEFLRLALTEVARQIEAGETSGLVHGLPWQAKSGMDADGMITESNCFTGGYTRHCGTCGMHTQTYNPPPETS